MARIRSVKPDFWVDDKIVDLSVLAKLLFIGLWNFADDDGYIEHSARRIKRQVFPDNDYDVAKALGELIACGMLREKSSDQGALLHIVHFRDHQKPQHPTPSKFTNIHELVREVESVPEDSQVLMSPHPVVESSSVEISATPRVTEADFETAYMAWPKKVERKKAQEQFKRVARLRGVQALTADIQRFGKAYAANIERQFTPALDVWIRNERWTDELPGSPSKPSADAWMNR